MKYTLDLPNLKQNDVIDVFSEGWTPTISIQEIQTEDITGRELAEVKAKEGRAKGYGYLGADDLGNDTYRLKWRVTKNIRNPTAQEDHAESELMNEMISVFRRRITKVQQEQITAAVNDMLANASLEK
jgi:hypothetical protein